MARTILNPESLACIMCGSKKLRNYKANAFDSKVPFFVNIIECAECVFAWQYPVHRTETESVGYFESSYLDNGLSHSDYFNLTKKKNIAKLEFEFIAKLPLKNKVLLDIGAGSGVFAEICSEYGWNVTAVDPALQIERLRNNSLITAIKGTIENISHDSKFSVITLWDVIEHVTNPVEIIQTAKAFLEDGGWLVIETGNFKSADRLNGGISHWMYQLDHKWYFSPETIRNLLTDVGFSKFVFSHRVLRPDWNGSLIYAGPSKIQFLKAVLKSPLHFREKVALYHHLKKSKTWEMSGIGIFAVAARV